MAPFSQVLEVGTDSERFRILVHGGAWDIPEALKAPHREGVRAAYRWALAALEAGRDPLEVVAGTLKCMEDDPVFDAGQGSFLNEIGAVELDAAVMEGSGLRAGAVAGLGCFANPGEVALAVLRRTEHVLLVGEGAGRFARAEGFEELPSEALIHPRERAAFERWVAAGRPDAKRFFAQAEQSEAGPEPDRRGTVGVVLGVRQDQGFALFAGTSTGGIPGKKVGRVGDVPLVGCGIYADDEGAAVSCTGWGEGLIRIAAAKGVNERVKAGQSPQAAVEGVLGELWRRTEGRGGIIALDGAGRWGAAFTTPDMAFAGPYCRYLDLGY